MTSLTKDFTSEAALQAFAASLSPHLRAGDVLLLDGDLGAGKTSFTKGLAKGLGITDYVKSPTFTIIREYRHGRLPLYHMDLYRLEDGGAEDLGLEEYFEGDGVSVVEWPDFLGASEPETDLLVHFQKDEQSDTTRHLEFVPQGKRYESLLQSLK
ncbi:tRNA (adenosine(37)-N6)-threonylcarbamoyltransferase complex ATPase subunit type 1 TsaE [Lacticaseibacillus chiayiensis]|uniref:tRNA threonylcarbamoyladenosine biosynthesis protein TsaE n=1 Tax=Lacticaseibacillus chiayiensis TaxID=2100821 RepID=A0A4Q1TMA3_9LACO|nr:tRNA (adenosine(37)-N6)-threonylcarbamoyltransferase complex ATPase subunit type 1 TsaE [Lacticaseibacillus chiayiensis]QVI35498.1 tRNA (adenosine(37)-N6)-threonylcarbamoyltransferase complex ATPase subunit type 1 TsaE [Lacticaseibacillus chiayiensis]RXT19028.1 tRNA (adenosine(37)-N6)-threonylcarbamoyltransferase complex ATPase subunit type 1 TsaE [Lacticaseibacillus chiayiensis]RXT59465.1 tRNA (adenosine(37)-N6)-threonylcarbamoyltransferase complex ATPase subunit type 1 TsaE [Lacticaseibacil